MTVFTFKQLIGGGWVDALDQGTWQLINPATEETLGLLPFGNARDAEALRRLFCTDSERHFVNANHAGKALASIASSSSCARIRKASPRSRKPAPQWRRTCRTAPNAAIRAV